MKKISLRVIVILCLAVSASGCQDKVVHYQGELIEIDFNHVDEITPGLWIKIDDWTFTHIGSLEEGEYTEFPLPTDYVIIDSNSQQGTERSFGAPLNPKNIGLHIGRHLRDINDNKLPEGEPKYYINNPALLSAIGVLRIAKTDSSLITITTPGNYPIKITVLNGDVLNGQ